MTATKEKVRAATPEQRQKAVAMVKAGATLREAAAVTGFSHQAIADWVKAAELERKTFRRRKRRGPVFVDGQRLGRLALWK